MKRGLAVLAMLGGCSDAAAPPRVAYQIPMTGVPVCAGTRRLVRALFVRATGGDAVATWGSVGTPSTTGLVYLAGPASVHLEFGLCPAQAGCTLPQVEWYAERTVTLDPATLQRVGRHGPSAEIAVPGSPALACAI